MTPQPEPIENIEIGNTIIPFENGGSYTIADADVQYHIFVNGNGLLELDPNLFKDGSQFQTRTPYTDTRMGYYTSGAGVYTLHKGGLEGEVIFTFYIGND